MQWKWWSCVLGTLGVISAWPIDNQHVFDIEHSGSLGETSEPFWNVLARNRILQVGDNVQVRTSELGKWRLRALGEKFMDITDYMDLGKKNFVLAQEVSRSYPKTVQYAKEVRKTFQYVSEKGPRADLKKFTSFYTRYYKSTTGRESQKWLLDQIKELASQLKPKAEITEFKHSWAQRTILLRISGRNPERTRKHGVTIVGAHLDSAHLIPFLRSPGADDDGSGTVTLLETLRSLIAVDWTPESDVEFHWYSAEEGGLLGSQAVAQEYEDKGIKVQAMLQQDMTAFLRKDTEESIGLMTDFVDPQLTDFIELLINYYLKIPAKRTELGYAGSDHASWRRANYPSAFAVEAPFELCNLRLIHTSDDTMDAPEFSFPHMLRFVHLSVAYIIELGGWA
ncbi:bacterial leucyl aminopeptidase [Malassezia yamatoensis]|uniref:Peptide hydrolase n=1 Tax=Malassezia yamatoensis TaxID=253288 RepID=A0AAJ5YQJ2_9BASI|nr:bacterial leucyl aminopeptidase [Malassezia yamatoensis]